MLDQKEDLCNSENFKVVVRVRPPSTKEMENKKYQSSVKVSEDHKNLSLYEYFAVDQHNPNNYFLNNFTFDHVFDELSTQKDVYDLSIKQSILSVLEGYNTTVLAYGQTGAGKTYTMEGYNSDESRGIIPRTVLELFTFLDLQNRNYKIKVSYFQIYNENIFDLLSNEKSTLQIREDKKRGIFVEGLSEYAVNKAEEVFNILQKGSQMRVTGSTKINDMSSRSHAIFIMYIEQYCFSDSNTMVYTLDQKNINLNNHQKSHSSSELSRQDYLIESRYSKLNFVDLAGSERVRATGATGIRLEESKKINQSLSALGNVISALTDSKGKSHIPYRDSKITRILEDSLGGNCKTVLMTMISPSSDAFAESLCSLKFATRAKKIKNIAVINQVAIDKTQISKMENQIKELQIEIEEKNKIINKFEKEEKVINKKNDELEKNEINELKELILKQKDVMITLSEKLKEKEEKIKYQNEELRTFDKLHQQLKEALNKEKLKTSQFEKTLKQNNIFKNDDSENNTFKTEIGEGEMTTRFRDPKNQEGKENKPKDCENKQFQKIKKLKNLIDEIIINLSKPNNADQLQNVAKDLLDVQLISEKLLKNSNKNINISKSFNNRKNPLLNITNFSKNDSYFNYLPKKKEISKTSYLNLTSTENPFNFIPIRGEVNINDYMIK